MSKNVNPQPIPETAEISVSNSNTKFWIYLADGFGTPDSRLLSNSDGDPVSGSAGPNSYDQGNAGTYPG
jgi:hypothetical protein